MRNLQCFDLRGISVCFLLHMSSGRDYGVEGSSGIAETVQLAVRMHKLAPNSEIKREECLRRSLQGFHPDRIVQKYQRLPPLYHSIRRRRRTEKGTLEGLVTCTFNRLPHFLYLSNRLCLAEVQDT